MYHVMFDVDGTLVVSDGSEENCFREAMFEVFGHRVDIDWNNYTHVTDLGMLDQHIDDYGLGDKRGIVREAFKQSFTESIAKYIKTNPAQQIPGAAEFIDKLRHTEKVSLSIATGGWYETATMKLQSAGINVSGIPIASSNDHFSRTGIMKIAREKAIGESDALCTYFGDGEWDKAACEALDFNFVLVGDRIQHRQNIMDFTDQHRATEFIGL